MTFKVLFTSQIRAEVGEAHEYAPDGEEYECNLRLWATLQWATADMRRIRQTLHKTSQAFAALIETLEKR